jgi:GH24 family phage-related lysozyme (muramidase)
MHQSVRDAFVPFTAPMEGVVRFLYLDVKGLVTTAIGNLVDPMEAALALPLMRPDGTRASREDIAAEWANVKARQDMRMRGGMAYAAVTRLRLTDEGVRQVVAGKLAQMESYLARRFPEWEEWPADAQLATLSMAWACGPAFRFPRLEAALRAQDWITAANECRMDERGNPGLRPRNKANRTLYRNAYHVAASGFLGPPLERDRLYWPAALEDATPTEAPPAPDTTPDFDVVMGMPDTVPSSRG